MMVIMTGACGCVFLQAEGQEVASMVSAQEIRVVAELLQVSPEGLQKSVTFKLTVSRTHDHTVSGIPQRKLLLKR